MLSASATYENVVRNGASSICQINKASFSGSSKDDNDVAKALYQRQRSRLGEFEQIKGNMRCPYCGVNHANQLDHYLPKADYQYLSVTPLNLIPCCQRCNGVKRATAFTAQQAETVLFNPYIEDFDDERWLTVSIAETPTEKGKLPAFIFSVTAVKPSGWSKEKFERLRHSFSTLKISEQYSELWVDDCNSWSTSFCELWDKYRDKKNPARKILKRKYKYCDDYGNKNYYQKWALKAALKSDWFCYESMPKWLGISQ
ncbi:hypothetical protein KIMH_13780 [Bombiscardovia apis]|uniref:HNH endonuclease n=2 Tax=Bombiscardovia apis TaxID=2932182 RepID=A0ABM8BEE6_9BIFI|nr:hypothetical protein KIMH_13780 [Bombiscardovia apis]